MNTFGQLVKSSNYPVPAGNPNLDRIALAFSQAFVARFPNIRERKSLSAWIVVASDKRIDSRLTDLCVTKGETNCNRDAAAPRPLIIIGGERTDNSTSHRAEKEEREARRGKGRRWRSDCVTRTCRAPVSVITISLRCVSEAASAASIISRRGTLSVDRLGKRQSRLRVSPTFPIIATGYNFQARSHTVKIVPDEIYISDANQKGIEAKTIFHFAQFY